jgi:hypothetical protein
MCVALQPTPMLSDEVSYFEVRIDTIDTIKVSSSLLSHRLLTLRVSKTAADKTIRPSNVAIGLGLGNFAVDVSLVSFRARI